MDFNLKKWLLKNEANNPKYKTIKNCIAIFTRQQVSFLLIAQILPQYYGVNMASAEVRNTFGQI
jgi:hypothetical protein